MKSLSLVAALLLVTASVQAQEKHNIISGTITKIDNAAKTVAVKTEDGSVVVFNSAEDGLISAGQENRARLQHHLMVPSAPYDGVPGDEYPITFTCLNSLACQTDMQAVRSKGSRPALVGRRSNRLSYVAAMRERQPLSQLAGRLLWGLAVERHHRSGHARLSSQLSTPPVTDGHHFDVVRTPADVFFEKMNGHLSGGPTADTGMSGWDQTLAKQSGASVILRGRHERSSEGMREGAVHNFARPRSSADPAKEKSASAGCPQDIHDPSTAFPQLGSVRMIGSACVPAM